MKRRLAYCLFAVACAVALFAGMCLAERHAPTLYADGGVLEVDARLLGSSSHLIQGWLEGEGGATGRLELRVKPADASNRTAFLPYLYVSPTATASLYIDGVPADAYATDGYTIYALPEKDAPVFDLELRGSPRSTATGSNGSVFAGTLPALIEQANGIAHLRLVVIGLEFAACFCALALWIRKRSERYLLAFALFAFVVLVRVLRRTFTSLTQSAAFGALPVVGWAWALVPDEAAAVLGGALALLLDFSLRYLVLRAFADPKLGSATYIWYYAGAVALYLVAALPNPASAFAIWAPVLLRLGGPVLEAFVLGRSYLHAKKGETAVLLFAWCCMLAVLVFNWSGEAHLLPTFNVGSRVGLGSVCDALVLHGLLYAICARFAGKFAEAEVLSGELERLNSDLEHMVALKTHELQDSYNSLQRSQQQKDEFLSNMAHNVKTPLFTVIGYTEMAQATLADDPARASAYLDNVKTNANRVQTTVKNLLLATRLEARRLSFTPICFDLARLLAHAVDNVRPKARERGVHVELGPVGQPNSSACTGDETFLLQAFENILDNAIDSCGEGGRVTVRIARTDPHAVTAVVEDTGRGIDDAALPHIFERYWSSKAPGPSGTGLGLPIAKDIVEQNGGRIRASSMPGQGSTFTIELPTVQEPERGQEPPVAERTAHGTDRL